MRALLGCGAASTSRLLHPSACLCGSLRPSSGKDLYAVLGIRPGASAKEIKSAYYELSKLHHPDASGETESAAKFTEVSEAYSVLGNEEQKREYDRTLAVASNRAGFTAAADPASRSFVHRHRPDSFKSDYDMDYEQFVQFQRKWRGSRRFAEQVNRPPPGYMDPEQERRFESFYRSQYMGTPHGFSRFVKEEFEDKDFETEQHRMEVLRQRAAEQERQRRLRREVEDLADYQRRAREHRSGAMNTSLSLATFLFTALILSAIIGPR